MIVRSIDRWRPFSLRNCQTQSESRGRFFVITLVTCRFISTFHCNLPFQILILPSSSDTTAKRSAWQSVARNRKAFSGWSDSRRATARNERRCVSRCSRTTTRDRPPVVQSMRNDSTTIATTVTTTPKVISMATIRMKIRAAVTVTTMATREGEPYHHRSATRTAHRTGQQTAH